MSESWRARCRRPAQTALAGTALSWTRRRETRSPSIRRARSERQACARCLTGIGWLSVGRAGLTVSTSTVWAAAKGVGVGATAVERSEGSKAAQHFLQPGSWACYHGTKGPRRRSHGSLSGAPAAPVLLARSRGFASIRSSAGAGFGCAWVLRLCFRFVSPPHGSGIGCQGGLSLRRLWFAL